MKNRMSLDRLDGCKRMVHLFSKKERSRKRRKLIEWYSEVNRSHCYVFTGAFGANIL